MIPRLQPRPSSRRPPGIENIFPANANANANVNIQPAAADTSTTFSYGSLNTSNTNGLSSEEDAQLSKGATSVDNAHLSPLQPPPPPPAAYEPPANSPVPSHYGNQYRHMLLDYSSSTSKSLDMDMDMDTDTSYGSMSCCSDFSLTPPAAGSRPLLPVSAKRYGSEVRRQHSKRRRRRRRPSSTRSDSQKSSSVLVNGIESARTASSKDNDDDALCLWKDEEDPYRPMNAIVHSSDKGGENSLPPLASSDEEEEQTDRIEEVVRAQHLKQATIAQGNDKLPPNNRPFSANRKPPPKGCLSNPRPKRPTGQATRYKTPPKSPEELDALSQSNVHQLRRVQFGIPSAVEYEIDRPPGHLTPMPQEVTRQRYSMDPKESTREEDEMTKETKENNTILSEWEDQFSGIRSNSNGSNDRARKSGSSSKRNRRNRRSSSIFSPASRMSLDYNDTTNESNCDAREKNDAKHSQSSLAARPSASPSAMVVENLASLNMSPSNTSLEESKNYTTTQTTPMPTAGSVNEQRTWDFVADLGSINSKGAMELSPHPSSPGMIKSASGSSGTCTSSTTNNLMVTEENTPPPPTTNANLDTINSFGAAFDNDSPNRGHSLRKDSAINDSSVHGCIEATRDESSNIITRTLIETPWLDQEWDVATVLGNLSFLRRKEGAAIHRCFASIDPCIHKALSYTKDLVDRVMRTPSSKATFPMNPSSKNSLSTAKKVIMTEWKEFEISFMEELTNMLEHARLEIEKTEILEAASKTLPLVKNCASLLPRNKQIEKEISKLENDIHQQRSSFDVLEACIAPRACILCQATAHLGIYGFCFEEFRDDNILKLNFVHAIFGVQTRVIFDINSQPGVVIEPHHAVSNRDKCCIFEFHQAYLNMLVCGKISLQLDPTELQDSLLKLGQFLGKLDQSAHAFKAINDGQKALVTFDLPNILLKLPANGTDVCMTLDPGGFVGRNLSVSTTDGSDCGGRSTEELSSVTDCCDLRCLQGIVSKYA